MNTTAIIDEKTTSVELDSPTVSIIIPCYNVENFLDETFVGLEKQTYQDFEAICINDGSKDHTLSILQKWQQKGTLRITIVDKKNAGVSSARNDGIKQAKGKYILFLDADDAYHSSYIQLLVESLEKTNADVAYCRLDRDYEKIINANVTTIQVVEQTQREAMHNLLYRMAEFGFYCYIYQREWLEKYGILFDSNTKFGEDREFNWKYLCHCQTACFVDVPLYWYRINNQSATKSKATWRQADVLSAVKRIEAYLSENNCHYSKEFNSYMYARAMWTVAKSFAIGKDKELFARMRKEYDVKPCMKRTAKDHHKLVAIASIIYLIHPMLFYYVVGLKR